jgi:hypothetical protein
MKLPDPTIVHADDSSQRHRAVALAGSHGTVGYLSSTPHDRPVLQAQQRV